VSLRKKVFKTERVPTTGRVLSRHSDWFAPHTSQNISESKELVTLFEASVIRIYLWVNPDFFLFANNHLSFRQVPESGPDEFSG
jgi:hypothetical protein